MWRTWRMLQEQWWWILIVLWDEDLLSSLGLSNCMGRCPKLYRVRIQICWDVSQRAQQSTCGCADHGMYRWSTKRNGRTKCFGVGDAKTTYGTGAFTLINTGDKFCASKHGLLTTVLYQMGSKSLYSTFTFIWYLLHHSLSLFQTPTQTILFHWRDDARGTLVGRTCSWQDVSRELKKALHFKSPIGDAMVSDSGVSLSSMRVDGGAPIESIA